MGQLNKARYPVTPIDTLLLSLTVVLVLAAPMTGSFLKCWADRAAAGQPVTGRSYCDACGETLAARDLVPILSWFWNRGRSRCCGAPLRPTLLTPEIAALGLALWAVAAAPTALLLPSLVTAWLLQAIALLAVPAPRAATILSMALAILGLGLAVTGLLANVEERLLGFALGLLIATVAWTARDDPRTTILKATTVLPGMGALLGVNGMGLALGIGLILAALHGLAARALARDPEAVPPISTSLAIGWAGGTWVIWLHADLLTAWLRGV